MRYSQPQAERMASALPRKLATAWRVFVAVSLGAGFLSYGTNSPQWVMALIVFATVGFVVCGVSLQESPALDWKFLWKTILELGWKIFSICLFCLALASLPYFIARLSEFADSMLSNHSDQFRFIVLGLRNFLLPAIAMGATGWALFTTPDIWARGKSSSSNTLIGLRIVCFYLVLLSVVYILKVHIPLLVPMILYLLAALTILVRRLNSERQRVSERTVRRYNRQ
jgi:hypothetical protein